MKYPLVLLAALLSSSFVPGALAAAPDDRAAIASRLDRWRAELPQGKGPYRVERLIEPDLSEYTVYQIGRAHV